MTSLTLIHIIRCKYIFTRYVFAFQGYNNIDYTRSQIKKIAHHSARYRQRADDCVELQRSPRLLSVAVTTRGERDARSRTRPSRDFDAVNVHDTRYINLSSRLTIHSFWTNLRASFVTSKNCCRATVYRTPPASALWRVGASIARLLTNNENNSS